MNQNTCKTCKWWQWQRYNELDSVRPVQFHCTSPHVDGKDLAGMVDGEDYGGVFTGPDFGCIHYEETQEQLPQDHPGYAAQQVKLEVLNPT